MKASWKDEESGEQKSVTAPLSVVISAFAPVANVRNTWTPTLRRLEDVGETILIYVDLAQGHKNMGGSAFAQAFGHLGDASPDLRDSNTLIDFFDAIPQLHQAGIVLAYHDISDGGLLTTIAEMCFAGRCGAEIMLDGVAKASTLDNEIGALFSEELGAVFQGLCTPFAYLTTPVLEEECVILELVITLPYWLRIDMSNSDSFALTEVLVMLICLKSANLMKSTSCDALQHVARLPVWSGRLDVFQKSPSRSSSFAMEARKYLRSVRLIFPQPLCELY